MPQGRFRLGAVTGLDGTIYAIGGQNGGSVPQGTVYARNPSTGAWTTKAALPAARDTFGCAVDAAGIVYVIAGADTSANPTTTVYAYNPATNTWSTKAALPSARQGVVAANGPAGVIYAIGGTDSSGAPTNTVYAYDIASNTWSLLTALPTLRTNAAAAVGSDGTVYVIGGIAAAGSNAGTTTVYAYHPATSSWSSKAPLPAPTYGAGATRGAHTTVYVAAGSDHSIGQKSVYAYDPASDHWSTSTAIPDALAFPAVTLGATGLLYVLGGRFSGVIGGVPVITVVTDVRHAATNAAPNAPTTTGPATDSTIDNTAITSFTFTFSDSDVGDVQSKFDRQYRLRGTSTWTTSTQISPNSSFDVAGGTFAPGDYEWQVRTYDSVGAVSPWSASDYFTAAVPPAAPTITAPTPDAHVDAVAELAWTYGSQDSYQARRVADAGGIADTAIVYSDTGEIADSIARSHSFTFDTNGRSEHLEVRVKSDALWSAWADVRILVAFTPPPTPSLLVTADDTSASVLIQPTNPDATGDTPPATSNDIYRQVTGDDTSRIRIATGIPVNTPWTDRKPTSGIDYTYQVVAVADDGATAISQEGLVIAGLIDGGSSAGSIGSDTVDGGSSASAIGSIDIDGGSSA